jgi:hypothetical protein
MHILARTALAVFMIVSCISAQEGAKKGPGFPPPPYKNLKLIEPDLLRETMLSWRPALGVQGTYCHVQGDFSSDEKPEKQWPGGWRR